MKTLERTFNESKVKKEFRQMIGIYDFWGKFTETKAAREVLKLADVKNGSVILDVACGTGELLEKVVPLNPDGQNKGVDLSPAMLNKAKEKLQRLNKGHVEIAEGNALNLQFPDNTFDLLFNNYMVDLMPVDTFDKIANEFFRVLKPGGILVMSTFSFGTKGVHKFWYWLAKTFPALLTNCRPVSFSAYLEKAGFKIEEKVEISQNTFPSEVIKAKKQV